MQHWHKNIEELLLSSFEEIFNDFKKRGLLLQYYSDVFGEKDLCSSCQAKMKKYYERLKNKLNQKNKKMSQFLFKKDVGAMQMSFGSGQFISNDNMTDELAIEYLKINPNRNTMFSKKPENWEELIGEEQETEKTPEQLRADKVNQLKNLNAPELAQACEDAGINPDDYKNKGLRAEAIVAKEEAEAAAMIEAAGNENLTDNEDNPSDAKNKNQEEE